MRPSTLFLFFFFSFCSNFVLSQNIQPTKRIDSSETSWTLLKYDTKLTFKAVGHSLSKPATWKSRDFTKLGILLAGTTALTVADNPTRDFFQNQKSNFPKVVRDFGWYFGSPQNYFIANAGLYGFGLITKNEKVRKTSVLIISSSITTGLIQTISKSVFGRARPGSDLDHLDFKPFSSEAKYHSFPSGHTALSITMAHAIAKQFDNTWTKIGIYTIGAIPPISRLIDDAHWITDIAFSAAISIIVVDSIDKYLFNEKTYAYSQKKKHMSWNLKFGGNQIGIVGSF
ncbi:phosphatase PAP2 family protein [Psychroserpens ponticola]|uniref:Phosphatase PAP2 family protein n=1 Tax=Psychroserpens ponticola TaxID=2932268 RepID=A0ABY7S0M0_9FLAO|nr:phosphatase PAP2 family protein [Psychroserpens ponticola]WCO02924.1 phosphatase PAP2 family protein [Psychroserpens ponticola]